MQHGFRRIIRPLAVVTALGTLAACSSSGDDGVLRDPEAVENPAPPATVPADDSVVTPPVAVETPPVVEEPDEKPEPDPKPGEKPDPDPKPDEKPDPDPKPDEKPDPDPKPDEEPDPESDPVDMSDMSDTGDDNCSVNAQNEWVYGNMLDYYLFYDQVPVVDPTTFDSPAELLAAVRFEERDPFSFLASAGSSDLAFDEGREFGLGYNWAPDGNGGPRIARVTADSPFGQAGIERGDLIVEIDGRPVFEVFEDLDYFGERVFGTREAPGDASWTFVDGRSGERFVRRIVATEYAIDTVVEREVFTNPDYDGAIGYFVFESFLGTSREELFDVFDYFAAEGVTDLVLDLRYNRGGYISITEQLASLILDSSQDGATLQRYVYNDKYAAAENFELTVDDTIEGLGLRRLVVLVGIDSASSSEAVPNSLDPLMDVTVIGPSRTSGKPYIQEGRDRCGVRLNAIEAEAVNAAGESVFGGIVPDCFAFDDRESAFGQDPETGDIEGQLFAGLDYLVNGTCEPFIEERARGSAEHDVTLPGQGSYTPGGALLER